jgi:hypothetical protein
VATDRDRLDDGFRNLGRAHWAGVLVGVPVLLLVALDAPLWVTTTFLVAVVIACYAYLVRQRRGPREKP